MDEKYHGLVYYRKSRTLHAPPGYEKVMDERPYNVKTVSLTEGSLLDMCLKFIALNVTLLDSLCGFPDAIGKRIFDCLIEMSLMNFEVLPYGQPNKQDEDIIRTLSLFSAAYGSLLLRSFSLANVREYQLQLPEILGCFPQLVEIDLSNMKLQDAVLTMLSHFTQLETLILSNTELSDDDIQKMTLPYRLYPERSKVLCILDVSANQEISNQSLDFLLFFHNLKYLNVSGTSVKMNISISRKIKKSGWHRSYITPLQYSVSNEGWAKTIMMQIIAKAEKRRSAKVTKTSSFYGTNVVKQSRKVKNDGNTLFLIREKRCREATPIPENKALGTGRNGTKRKFVLDTDDVDVEDMIFQQYLPKCSIPPAKKKPTFSSV